MGIGAPTGYAFVGEIRPATAVVEGEGFAITAAALPAAVAEFPAVGAAYAAVRFSWLGRKVSLVLR